MLASPAEKNLLFGSGASALGDDLGRAAGQASGDGAGLDPPDLIPGDAEQVGGPLDRALPEQVEPEPLEEGGELAPGSAQGTGSCFTPWAGHATRGTAASIHVVN